MPLHRVLVVDDSPAIRETIGILLSLDHEVHASTIAEYLSHGIQENVGLNLIVAAADDRLLSAAGHLPGHVPILWLVEDSAEWAASDPKAGQRLSRRFSPHELRTRVEALVSQPPATPSSQHQRQRLRTPYLTAEAARLVAEALTNNLPVHLFGEPGTGKRSVARAIHSVAGRGPLIATTGETFVARPPAVGAARRATLFIDRVDHLCDQGQQQLLDCLEPDGMINTPGGIRMRLITAAPCDLATILDRGLFSRELYYRLTILSAHLPPLRHRPEDIPGIARLVAAELAAWLGLPGVSFTQRALDRLSRYLWFGNLAELETVLARTLSIRQRTDIDADDLLFEGRRLLAAPPAAPISAGTEHGPRRLASETLELIINELAHEFKNPLLTIKTFAHHLRQALRDGNDEQVAQLTGEAVDRMDHTLENLLQFTRFHKPQLRSIQLSAALKPVLEEQATQLASRGVRLDCPPPPPMVIHADGAQVGYALSNLLRTLSRSLGGQDEILVRYLPPVTITFQLPSGSDPLGSHLATLLDGPGGAEEALPLGVAIAKVVLERNGAQVTIGRHTGPTIVTVRFAPGDQEETAIASYGQAPRTDR